MNTRKNLKNSMLILIGLNLCSYLHIFKVHQYIALQGIEVVYAINVDFLWVVFYFGFFPWIFIILTSLIFAKGIYDEYLGFRFEAISDWCLRIIAYILVLQNRIPMVYLSENYRRMQALLVGIFIISLLLELRMCFIARKYIPKPKLTEQELKVTDEEKMNLENMYIAFSKLFYSPFIFTAFSLVVGASVSTRTGGNYYLSIVVVFMSMIVYFWYIKTLHKSMLMYYVDKKIALENFSHDAILASIAYFMCLLARYEVLGIYTIEFKKFSLLFGILIISPIILRNRKRALRIAGIKEALAIKKEKVRNV